MEKGTQKSGTQPVKKTDARPIVRELEPMRETKLTLQLPVVIIALAIIISGGITGFVLAKGSSSSGVKRVTGGGTTAEGLSKVVGVADVSKFKDSPEGKLLEGGTEKGEGTHHLERPGGPSQNVYLTSSTVPLDDYVGKDVKVWGETFAAETAGWFMDVARLEVK